MGLKKEIWKDIKGYEGWYQVSNLGNVKSLNRGNRNGRKLVPNSGRYKGVFLCMNGSKLRRNIHRLVAETFLKNIENKPFVNHKDGNKFNNEASNLEWCTHYENMKHAHINGLIPKYTDELRNIRRLARLGSSLSDETKNKISSSLSKPIKCINDDLVFNSIKSASEYYGISKTTFHRKFNNNELILGKQFIEWYNQNK